MTSLVSVFSVLMLSLASILMISGFVEAECFKLHLNEALTWHEANTKCAQENGHLYIVNSRKEIDAVAPFLESANKEHVHVGHHKSGAGSWRYVNGEMVSQPLWGPGQPSGDGSCGNLLNAARWNQNWHGWHLNDEPCNTKSGFICEHCPGGFQSIGNGCYWLNLDASVTWNQAEEKCQQVHGHLAVLKSQSQIDALKPYLQAKKKENVHVGHKKMNSGWRYVNGEMVSQPLWGPSQPSGDGSCGNLLNAARWNQNWPGWRLNDEPCSTKSGFICER